MSKDSSSQTLLAENQEGQHDVEKDETTPITLQRSLGVPGAIALLAGTIIGSGIFATPKWVLFYSGSVAMSFLVWTFCGILALFGALCYSELGTMFPKSGGEFQYLLKAYGSLPAFLFSWTFVLFTMPATEIMVLLVFGSYVIEAIFPSSEGGRQYNGPADKILAAIAMVFIAVLNCASVKWAIRVQIIFTYAKMVAIVMITVTGFVRLAQGHTAALEKGFHGTNWEIGKFAFAFYNGLFSYDGWNHLNYVTEEIKNLNRNLPLTIWIGIPLVTSCYIMVNIGYLTVLTPQEFLDSDAVAVTVANQIYGVMAWSIPVLVAFSTFGAANGYCFGIGRATFAAAREGHLPRFLAMIHTKTRTPLPGIIFSALISLLMLIPEKSSFEVLLNYFGFFSSLFFLLTCFSVLWLRYKRPEAVRPYKVWLPIPVIMTLVFSYLVISPFFEQPLEMLYCVVFLVAGIPFYFIFVRYKVAPPSFLRFIDRITLKLERICNVAIPESEEDLNVSP